MRRVVLSWITVVVLLAAAPIVAQSPRIDQLQPNIDPLSNLIIGSANSDQKLAQTVTMGVSGRVQGVYLPIACQPGTKLIVEIHDVKADGSPGTVMLARRRVNGDRLPSSSPFYFKFIRLRGALVFAAADQFAITLEVEPAFNSLFTCGINQGPLGDSYAGGQGWYDALPNVPRSWLPTGRDHPFMVVAR